MAKSKNLNLLQDSILPQYLAQMPTIDWPTYAKNIPKVSFTSDNFSFNASVSSVYSSKIEGENIELDSFFKDLQILTERELPFAAVLYYGAMLHLVLLKIHPFEDGNGRMARLLEKWFLATKLGTDAWNIPSEQFYYQNLATYYRNVHIGFDYEGIDYTRSLPFLLMLPQSIQHQS